MGEWLSFYDNMSLQYNIDKCNLEIQTMEQCANTHPDEVSLRIFEGITLFAATCSHVEFKELC
jgi:hypothetical protein